MEIIAKRHPYKFYFRLIIIDTFLLILSSFILDNFNYSKESIIGSFILLVVAISITVGFIKNAPGIKLNNIGIAFKDKFYRWEELSIAKLTGKGGMIFTSMECATLTFKDKMTLQIHDDFYLNISELKCFIQEVVLVQKGMIEIKTNEKKVIDIESESFISYKGNPLFSFLGIFIWVLILLLILLIGQTIKDSNIKGLLVLTTLTLLFFYLFFRLMHYFEISANFFCVRKYYFPWKKEQYLLYDIREFVIELQGNSRSSRLRLITNDFKTKLFPAVSLYDKTWLKMKKDLENKNIIVRNENIYENN